MWKYGMIIIITYFVLRLKAGCFGLILQYAPLLGNIDFRKMKRSVSNLVDTKLW